MQRSPSCIDVHGGGAYYMKANPANSLFEDYLLAIHNVQALLNLA